MQTVAPTVVRPSNKQEEQELENFREYAQSVIADGTISKADIEDLNQHMSSSRAVANEEVSYVQELVREQIQQGQLEVIW
jgi:hypothetical protein